MKYFLWQVLALSLILCGCRQQHGSAEKRFEGDTLTYAAKYLSIIDCGNFSAVEIFSPWSDSVPIGKYLIIHNNNGPDIVPEGYEVISAPLERSVVFSSAYTAAINELGRIGAVSGVADGSFFLKGDTISALIAEGKVKDIGSSMAPLIETVIDISPEAILLSPYANVSATGLERTGIPMVWMADYLETSPLGRAEWILLLGELYGEREKSREIYYKVTDSYNAIKSKTADCASKPLVISEKPMSGIWYVPGGDSYIAAMFRDAGALYPWNGNNDSGSLPLDEAAVIDAGSEADYWLIKDTRPNTIKSLQKELPRAAVLKPFPSGIFYCNTLEAPYYDVIAFHPDRILSDMAKIFHPELFDDCSLEFYQHMK